MKSMNNMNNINSINNISNIKRQSICWWVEVNYAHTIPAHGMSKVGLEDGGGWWVIRDREITS